jgi:hypothetical protein
VLALQPDNTHSQQTDLQTDCSSKLGNQQVKLLDRYPALRIIESPAMLDGFAAK